MHKFLHLCNWCKNLHLHSVQGVHKVIIPRGCTLNARTLAVTGAAILLDKEFTPVDISISRLQEVSWLGFGELFPRDRGFHWSGGPDWVSDSTVSHLQLQISCTPPYLVSAPANVSLELAWQQRGHSQGVDHVLVGP